MKKYSNNDKEQIAFENACDYFYFGMGKKSWIDEGHNQGLSKEVSDKVWHDAFEYMASEECLEED